MRPPDFPPGLFGPKSGLLNSPDWRFDSRLHQMDMSARYCAHVDQMGEQDENYQ
jgi:hypothetical protein